MTDLEAKAKDCIENHTHKLVDKPTKQDIYLREESIFISGYKLGATENGIQWHKVADGDLPKENEYIMIYSKLEGNIAVGKRRCAGKIHKRCVYEWYFATYEGTYCLKDKDIIAWCEVPKFKE